MRRLAASLVPILVLTLAPLSACDDDGGGGETADATGDVLEDVADAGDVQTPEGASFAFGLDPTQTMSAAPFPNDLYLAPDGAVDLAALGDDPRFSGLAKPEVLSALDEAIAERDGFGVTSAVHFYADGAVDPSSAEGRVTFETLSGPEAGRSIPARAFWFEPGGILGAMPDWGHWLMAGSTYAVLVERGVTDADGEEIAPPADFQAMLAADAPTGADASLEAAREMWAPVREHLDTTGRSPDEFVVGTIFTTGEVLAYGQRLFEAVDAFPLEAPTRRVRWDSDAEDWVEPGPTEGAALEDYFGTPEAPFEYRPGRWSGGVRGDAAALPDADGAYEGGSLHAGIGRVVHGSVVAPAFNRTVADEEAVGAPLRFDGQAPTWDVRSMIPFSLFLCEEHLTDPSDLPVAIFTHGGTAVRADAIGFATANCLSGVATIAMDLPFHGGRTSTTFRTGQGLVVPTYPDDENAYTGLEEGDEGFVPDHVGDGGGATTTVAPLFAVPFGGDPQYMEANLLQIAAEQYTLLRLLREGDWSQVQAGLSFDPDRVLHQSLSFGSSFTTVLAALADDLAGVVTSVGSGMILSANLPTAPSNADLAAGMLVPLLGLASDPPYLLRGAWRDPVVSMHQWLMERADPLTWAPYVVRHRPTDRALPVLGSSDSWDGTLYTPAQTTYMNAYGLEPRSAGEDWSLDPTVPGAGTVSEVPFGGSAVTGNVTHGERTHTAVATWYARSCHSQVTSPLCVRDFEPPYPPIVPLDDPFVERSPICALQHQARGFAETILSGGPAEVVAPAGTCEDLYAR
ncbi:MAG: hypothetical protein ACQEXJ_22230 [Myxococcota bacterium]